MKTPHTILAIALSAALSGTAFAASTADSGSAATSRDNWLQIPAIYDKVTAAGYSDINEIERDKDGYEIKAHNADGDRVKLYVDPVTGEVLDVKAKKDKSDKRRSDRTDATRDRGADALPNDAK